MKSLPSKGNVLRLRSHVKPSHQMHLSSKAEKILVKTKLDLACLCFWSQKFESKNSSTWRKKEINNNKNSTLKGSYVIKECTNAVIPHSGYLGAPRSSGSVLYKNLHRQADLSVRKTCACRDIFSDFCTNILGAHFLCGLSRELAPKCRFPILFLTSAYMPQLSTTGSDALSFDSCGFWCIFRTR